MPFLCYECYEAPCCKGSVLCEKCYEDYEVFLEYQEKETEAVKPTQAEPGSPEKIAILTERFAKRESLFHPDDFIGTPRLINSAVFNKILSVKSLQSSSPVFNVEIRVDGRRRVITYDNFQEASIQAKKLSDRQDSDKNQKRSLMKDNPRFWSLFQNECRARRKSRLAI